jgi:hypothetical protein
MPSIVPMQSPLNTESPRRGLPSIAITHSRHAGINKLADVVSPSAKADLLVNNSELRRMIQRSFGFEITMYFPFKEENKRIQGSMNVKAIERDFICLAAFKANVQRAFHHGISFAEFLPNRIG